MAKKQATQDTSWEIKDRTYLLTGNNKPLTLKIPSRHIHEACSVALRLKVKYDSEK